MTMNPCGASAASNATCSQLNRIFRKRQSVAHLGVLGQFASGWAKSLIQGPRTQSVARDLPWVVQPVSDRSQSRTSARGDPEWHIEMMVAECPAERITQYRIGRSQRSVPLRKKLTKKS